MNETQENVLIEALDLMEQGLSVAEIVARFPDEAADLRPFLMTATSLSTLATQPALSAEAQSKRSFLAEADRLANEAAHPVRVTGGWLRRLVVPALGLLAILFLAGTAAVGASGSAVPGDALYETKRFVEETRLNLTNDPERAATLREQFRLERVSEIEQLLAAGRAAEVSLTGVVEAMAIGAMDGESWTVAGVPVLVPAGAIIEGEPAVGAQVQVDGRTENNAVTAERVMVLSGLIRPIDPTPAPPRPTATIRPPAGPTPANTDAANDNDEDGNDNNGGDNESNDSPSGQQPIAPAASPTPAPPAVTQPPAAPPPPTATPDDDDDNANDNGDDNANDNSDDNADDNDGGDDANDNGGDDANDNDDDNANDNGDDDANDNGDDNANDNGDDNANENDGGDDDNANDNGDDNANDNGDDNANDNGDQDDDSDDGDD